MKHLYTFWLSSYIKQGKSTAVFLIILTLVFVNFSTFSQKLEQNRATSDNIRATSLERFKSASENVEKLAESSLYLSIPPSEYEFIADTNFSELPVQRRITPYTKNVPFSRNSEGDVSLSVEAIDLAYIVEIMLTFLAVALSFDAINGEKSNGTLKLLLSNNLPRWKIYFSKYLALVTVLLTPVIVGAVMHITLMHLFVSLALSSETVLLYILFMCSSVFLLMVFAALGFLVSTSFKTPVTGFVVLVMAWSVLVLVLPGSARLLGESMTETMTAEEYQAKVQELKENFDQEWVEKRGMTRPPELARQDDFKGERVINEIQQRENTALNAVAAEHINLVYRQALTIHGISMISPTYVYRYLLARLADQDFVTVRQFIENTGQYSEMLFRAVREADAGDASSPHLIYMANKGNGGYISSEPFSSPPAAYQWRKTDFADRFTTALVPMAILIIETLLLLIIGMVLFNRFDVR